MVFDKSQRLQIKLRKMSSTLTQTVSIISQAPILKSAFSLLFLSFFAYSLSAQYNLEIKIPTTDQKGTVLLGLYNGPNLYLTKEGMFRHCVAQVNGEYAICKWENLPPGDYSMAMLIDLNGNQKMDFNFIGWPKEDYGFYPDPGFLMRKPRFEESNFQLNKDMSVEMRVR